MLSNKNGGERPDVAKVLAGLKDFQRQTVDYAFRRIYEDKDAASRFLIADEVGLGKTLVARGLIARAVDALWTSTERIDVIYICSNQEIAQQNIDRLNITQDRHFQLASRATLLPVTLNQLRGNKLNFVSLTPGTSFNLRSSTGWMYERVLLYHLILKSWNVSSTALSNVLRADVGKERWAWEMQAFRRDKTIDQDLHDQFLAELGRNPDLLKEFEELVTEIGGRRKHTPDDLRRERNRLIGQFRELLARSSLSALEPDLVILDEFQRFKDLLDADNPLSSLAQSLFNYPAAKVLLLSATPYKMYTVQGEDEDHYQDFQRTARFLLEGFPGQAERLDQAIERYRKAMLRITLPDSRAALVTARTEIETILRKVMVRTERLSATEDRNGMLKETTFARDSVRSSDLRSFVSLDRIAHLIDAGDQVEYWKSSAYPLNLMENYVLKRRLKSALSENNHAELHDWLRKSSDSLLHWEDIQDYQPVDPGNARLRALAADTLDTNNYRLLWMPPAMPYYQPGGAFANVLANGRTKTLIFSSWQVAPKTIAVLLSYEAERRIIGEKRAEIPYGQLTEKRRPLLRFAFTQERLANMSNFCLLYPSLTLAGQVDPLSMASELMKDGSLPSAEALLQVIEARIEELLEAASKKVAVHPDRTVDDRWYWVAPLLIDRHFNRETVENWLFTNQDNLNWAKMLGNEKEDGEDDPNRFADHVEALRAFFQSPDGLGPRPKNLVGILAQMALASPTISTLRAILRRAPGAGAAALAAAAHAGLGFRTLYNQPETILLLQDMYPNLDYWQGVLQYGIEGNLQSVLDEFVHILHESLGLVGHPPEESASKIGAKIQEVLSIRAPILRFDEFVSGENQRFELEDRRLRCRYALRIGEDNNDELDGRTRAADVRDAFNSPFRPFVLASTSIGQEGLDFHQYCHRIVHWNLPTNPVDLEQREGRIHRYKGHVIRRNLADHYASAILAESSRPLSDPWQQIFDQAVKDRPAGANDLIPFWIFEHGEHKIERRLPILPFSRETYQVDDLKKALVAYRALIGQPRQQELMDFIQNQASEEVRQILMDCSIDLQPRLETGQQAHK